MTADKQDNYDDVMLARKALFEIAPIKLADNLDFFSKNFPDIYAQFRDYKPSERYLLTCLANGEPDLFDTKSNKLIYGGNSFNCCRELVKSLDDFSKGLIFADLCSGPDERPNDMHQYIYFHSTILRDECRKICSDSSEAHHVESIPAMFMFGLGLGFQLGYLYEKMTPVNLFIVEPNLDFFYYSLCVFDYRPFFEYIKKEGLRICFYINTSPKEFYSTLTVFLLNTLGVNLPFKLLITYRDNEINKYIEIMERDYPTMVLSDGFLDDYLFGFNHSQQNISSGVPFMRDVCIPCEIADIPVVVVGNGPSLDDEIDLLYKYQDRCFIVACGTAYSALCRCNICADIYIAVERTPGVYNSLMAVNENREFFDQTICFALEVVQPKVVSLFKHGIIIPKTNELTALLLTKNYPDFMRKICTLSRTNPLVSNFGLELSSRLGFKKVYILGIDNGSVSDNSHSFFSLYYDDEKKLKDRYKNMILDEMKETMPGNFVSTVRTNALFKNSASIMESTIISYPHTKFYNCSNGMKIEGAVPKRFSETEIPKKNIKDKISVRQSVYNQLAIRFDSESAGFGDLLYNQEFTDLLSDLLHKWDVKPKTRVEFVLREMDLLDYIRKRFCDGSAGCLGILKAMESFLYAINYVLYCFEDEVKAVDLAYSLMLRHMRGLFEAAKYLTANVNKYEYGEHAEIVDHALDMLKNILGEEEK